MDSFARFALDNLWRDIAGLPEVPERRVVSYDEMAATQWSEEFEQLMKNRLVFGGYRYGRFGEPGKPKYDSVKSAIKRLKLYQENGNQEHLVDAANLCLVEYVERAHPLAHFESTDDGVHSEVKR